MKAVIFIRRHRMVCSCGARYPDYDEYCYYCGARNCEYHPPEPKETTAPENPPHPDERQLTGQHNNPGPPPYQGQLGNQGHQNNYWKQSYQGQGQRNQYLDEYHERLATRAANMSLVCGIIGFFIGGLILGIIAIVQGNKAKRLGYPGGRATVGLVLGIIDVIAWAIIVYVMFSTGESMFYF